MLIKPRPQISTIVVFTLTVFFYLTRPSSESEATLEFSQVYGNESFFGISLKSQGLRTNLSESVEEISTQYQSWIAYQKNEMPEERQKEWIALCRTSPLETRSPFCPFFIRESKNRLKTLGVTLPPRREAANLLHTQNDALKAWKSNHWELLAGRSESEIQPILKAVGSAPSALKSADLILKKGQCISSSLLFGLGLKLESAFPKAEYRTHTEALYQMALNCGQDYASAAAGYRLGLFKIWEGQYEQAEQILSHVPDLPIASDFRMRIGYWRYFCADKNKNELAKAQLRAWVTREYPLSLHSLLVHSNQLESDLQWRDAVDPEVRFRPDSHPELSWTTAAIEYLLLKHDLAGARYLLVLNQELALKQTPQFRLYWAILFKRAGVASESFRFMASAFRENPKLIARSTLEILYPRHFLELVPADQSHLDRFFILSIIRQESAFDPNALSPAQAMGLMQLQLPTARTFERKVTREQLFEPTTNIRIGKKYINRLLENEKGAVELALAAYNAGPGRIRQWKSRYAIALHLLLIDLLPARETREYVSSILRNYFWYLKLYSKDPPSRSIASQFEPFLRSMIPNP